MRHRLISAIISLLFLVLIQIFYVSFTGTNGHIGFLWPIAFAVYFLAFAIYNYFFLKQQGLMAFWVWLRPIILIFAFLSIYLILPSTTIKGLFLIFATLILFLIELNLSLISEQMNFLQTLLTYFGLCLGFFGLSFYFLPSSTLILLGLFLFVFLASRSSLDHIPQSGQKKNYFALILAAAALELGWVLILLPFHFTFLALVLFNALYVLWIIIYYYLFNNLNPKKIAFHVVFAVFLIAIGLISTPWK